MSIELVSQTTSPSVSLNSKTPLVTFAQSVVAVKSAAEASIDHAVTPAG